MSDVDRSPTSKTEGGLHAFFWAIAPLLFVGFWAGGYSFGKFGLQYTSPMTLLSLRFAGALLVLLPLLFLLKVTLPKTRQHWGALIVLGALMQGGYFGLTYFAIQQGIDAGTAALVHSLQPILVAILAPKLVGERVTRVLWLGLIMGLSGVVVVVVAKYQVGPSSMLAIFFVVAALFGMTGATLFEKRFGTPTHFVVNGLVQYAVGLAVVLPLAVSLEAMEVTWHPNLFIALTYLILGNSIIAVTIFVGLIQRGSASKVSALFFLVPPLALLMAWALVGETMPPLAWIGLVLSMMSIYVVNRAT